MARYSFDQHTQAAYEQSVVPVGIYQLVDGHVVTLVASDGLCELFGYETRAEAVERMDRDMYWNVHPDDAKRVSDAASAFRNEDQPYNLVCRVKIGSGYRLIHTRGRHITTETGQRLAVVWFIDEGEAMIDEVTARDEETIEALKASMQSLLNNMPALTFSKDVETGAYLACNQMFAEYANKNSPAEVVGLTDHDIFDQKTADHFVTDDKIALSMDEPYVLYEDAPDAVGNSRQFQTTKLKFVDETGRLCLLGMSMDVTEVTRIKKEVEQSQSDKVLRSAVIEALTRVYDSVWLINDIQTQRFELYRIDENLVHLMPASAAVKLERFSDAFGFYAKLVLEEDRERFLDSVTPEAIVKNTADRLIYSVPFRRVFGSGIRYYRVEFAKLDLPGGETGIVIGFKDVDEEVHKEQQIQHSLSLRSAVIEALTRVYDSVWLIHDMETRSFELYRVDEKMSHLLPAQTVAKLTTFSDAFAFYSGLVLEEDRQAFLDAVTPENIIRNTENQLIYSVPFRRVFESGIRYYRVEFARLELEDDLFQIVLGFKDVDEEVRKEQQIQQALREAMETANSSNKAKSDFLSSMSHDMRTPMNGIIGMTTIAANHLDDTERVADCLRKIKDSSNHLLALINEVLDMNKIESGKVELQEEEFCLADLIDGMLTMTRPQILSHEHSFRVNIVNVEHEQLIGDSRRIEQVFVNIMSNAIKYTPNGGRITLSVIETSAGRPGYGHYQFIFEDNGYGMTEEFQKHLFEPFARANDVAGIQGTGLGMAITRNIVRMMGGDIAVHSVYGEGSRFTVNMYLKLQNVGAINYDAFTDLRILVADDDPVCCESVCEILNDMGMNSEWVLSGKAAVDRVKTRQEQGRDFFTILVDWKLPDQDGVVTVRQMRQLVGQQVPIVIISAYDWIDIEEEARDAGTSAFISKPLFRTKLATLFNSLVNNQTNGNAPDEPLCELEEMELDGRRVLLAEDMEINAEIAMTFLEMTGLEVDWARDGKQAVDMLTASDDGYYSMVFMDVQMPNMNGYEATQAIRAMERPYAKNIPIVAMTANAFAEDKINAKNAGMDEHIIKPIDVDALARVLNKYVK